MCCLFLIMFQSGCSKWNAENSARYIVSIYTYNTLGPQNHEEWRVLTPQYMVYNPLKWRLWVPMVICIISCFNMLSRWRVILSNLFQPSSDGWVVSVTGYEEVRGECEPGLRAQRSQSHGFWPKHRSLGMQKKRCLWRSDREVQVVCLYLGKIPILTQFCSVGWNHHPQSLK